jgi:hypothetical protein
MILVLTLAADHAHEDYMFGYGKQVAAKFREL